MLTFRESNSVVASVTMSDVVSTLNGSNGGESPARAALSLVLDRHKVVIPVLVSDDVLLEVLSNTTSNLLGTTETETSLELLSSQVSELVDSEGVGVTLAVLSDDVVEVILESLVLGEELVGGVGLVVLLNEGGEHVLASLFREEGSVDRGESGQTSSGKDGLHL